MSSEELARQKKSTRKALFLVFIFVVLPVLCCGVYAISDSASGIGVKKTAQTENSIPVVIESTSIPSPSNTPPVLAPPFVVIRSNVSSMTEAQWKAYLPTLKDMRVEGWTGWVEEVNVVGSKYELWVDMDSPDALFSVQDVYFYIPSEIALELEKHQRITFSGRIKSVTELLGSVSVRLEDATLTTKLASFNTPSPEPQIHIIDHRKNIELLREKANDGTGDVQIFEGVGDDVIELSDVLAQLLYISGNSCEEIFSVKAYGANGESFGFEVVTSDSYLGERLLFTRERTDVDLEVKAQCAWEIFLLGENIGGNAFPNIGDTVRGSGAAIIVLKGEGAEKLRISHIGGHRFVVISWGTIDPNIEETVNVVGDYSVTVPAFPGLVLIEVREGEDWEITIE